MAQIRLAGPESGGRTKWLCVGQSLEAQIWEDMAIMKVDKGPYPRGLGGPHLQYSLCKTSLKGFSTGQCQAAEQSLWQCRCVHSKMTLWSSPVYLISIIMKTSRNQGEINTDMWTKCINMTANKSK